MHEGAIRMTDIFDTPDWAAYRKDVTETLVPMIRDSAVSATIWTGKDDVKIAVELGFTILLDKPLLVIVLDGAKVPERLRRAADEVIVARNITDPDVAQRIADFVRKHAPEED